MILKGLLAEKGVEGFLVFNDAGACSLPWPGVCSAGAQRLQPPSAPHSLPPHTCMCAHTCARTPQPPCTPGIPLKWTNSGFIKPGTVATPAAIPPAIIHHTALAHDLTSKAKTTCHRILGEAEGELQLMRLHCTTKEYIIAPAEHETLLVVQSAHSAALEPLIVTADAQQLAALAHASKGKDEKAKK